MRRRKQKACDSPRDSAADRSTKAHRAVELKKNEGKVRYLSICRMQRLEDIAQISPSAQSTRSAGTNGTNGVVRSVRSLGRSYRHNLGLTYRKICVTSVHNLSKAKIEKGQRWECRMDDAMRYHLRRSLALKNVIYEGHGSVGGMG